MQCTWHWLDESVPLSSMLYLPSCQIQFQRDAAEELDQLGADASNASRAALSMKGVAKFVERSRDYDLGNRWYIELSVNKHIPKPFRSRGMLWWFQVLTTFLVRVRDPIAPRLRESAALQTLMHRVGGNESGGVSLLDSSTSQDRGFDAVWKALPLDPHLHFDLGLHVRMGDACGWKSARREIMRHCVANLSDALTRIGPVNGGVVDRRRRRRPARATSLFIASDSQAILDEARQVHDARISHVHTLEFQRDRYETGAAVEAVLSRENNTVLEEALLDLLVLSQARVLAGAMLSNMPRLALQMRVRPHLASDRLTYRSMVTAGAPHRLARPRCPRTWPKGSSSTMAWWPGVARRVGTSTDLRTEMIDHRAHSTGAPHTKKAGHGAHK